MPDIFDSSQPQFSQASQNQVGTISGDSTVVSGQSAAQTPSQLQSRAAAATSADIGTAAFQSVLGNYQSSTNPLNSFATLPANTSFNFQLDQENVLLLLRQHPVTQIYWILIAIILIFVPFLFEFVPILSFLPPQFHVVALIGWYLMIVSFSLESFLDWFYNVCIVTDQRVIDVNFTSLLFKDVSTAQLDRIEDVTATTSGYLSSIFDFGDVTVQTAGEKEEFRFDKVPHPNRVSALINELLLMQEQARGER